MARMLFDATRRENDPAARASDGAASARSMTLLFTRNGGDARTSGMLSYADAAVPRWRAQRSRRSAMRGEDGVTSASPMFDSASCRAAAIRRDCRH